jgi:NAD(P)-dependent dehydrogenase (short-subunit alcohol dehydrogenase family)
MAATPDFSVAGKHVLITGGTGGIGSAFAKAFLDHGANVIVADLAAPEDGTDPRIRYEQLAPAYSAAKTGVVSLTKSLAISFAEDGIRVNAIAPGWIKTELTRPGRENPEFNSKVVARIPGGEWAEAEDLAGAAIFLASPASKLINGVTIPVDGGYTAS